ncbi:MAG: class I SAM-dependent methyltransferase [Pseudomonadota bacterium]
MPIDDPRFKQVYGAKSAQEARAVYADWATRYDAENLAKGFLQPGMAAAAIARFVPPDAGDILEAGCGTGLIGLQLATLGYERLIGLDLTPQMLALAEARGCYFRLIQHDLSHPIPLADDSVAATACFGSFGPGHAPPACLAEFVRVTRPGGLVLFNLREDVQATLGFPEIISRLSADKLWQELFIGPLYRAFLLAEPEIVGKIRVYRVC